MFYHVFSYHSDDESYRILKTYSSKPEAIKYRRRLLKYRNASGYTRVDVRSSKDDHNSTINRLITTLNSGIKHD